MGGADIDFFFKDALARVLYLLSNSVTVSYEHANIRNIS